MNAVRPDLTGRTARCFYYGRNTALNSRHDRNECNYGQETAAKCSCEKASCVTLPHFEYRGEGSKYAAQCKHCACDESMHTPERAARCSKYEPRGGVEHDSFYCGCNGWD